MWNIKPLQWTTALSFSPTPQFHDLCQTFLEIVSSHKQILELWNQDPRPSLCPSPGGEQNSELWRVPETVQCSLTYKCKHFSTVSPPLSFLLLSPPLLISLSFPTRGVLSLVQTFCPPPPGFGWVNPLSPFILAPLPPVLFHHLLIILSLLFLLTFLRIWLIWVVIFQVAITFDLWKTKPCFLW